MSDTNTVDYLLQSVAARGLKLANLFQFEVQLTGEWRWQANVTDGERCWEFGRGSTAIEALRAALFTAANEAGLPVTRRPKAKASALPTPDVPIVEEDFRL